MTLPPPLAFLLAALVCATAFAAAPDPASAQQNTSICPRVPAYPWQGVWHKRTVKVPNRAGGTMTGTVYRPADRRRFGGRRPGMVLTHGKTGNRCSLSWAARTLAGHGYVALTLSAGRAGKVDALRSGVTFLRSGRNPFRRVTLGRRIGVGGWSQGAVAAGLAQAEDRRIRAIVALDSLQRYAGGDWASASECMPPRRQVIRPRVPALGIHSDAACTQRTRFRHPDLKKTGYLQWRRSRVPAMSVVVRGSRHIDFGRRARLGAREARSRHIAAHYMVAWLDRFLANRRTADRRLIARQAAGRHVGWALSVRYRSALFSYGTPARCRGNLRRCLGR